LPRFFAFAKPRLKD